MKNQERPLKQIAPGGRGSESAPREIGCLPSRDHRKRSSAASKARATAIAFLMLSWPLLAAEPDWPAVEKHALDLLQKYVRIASVNPPANTTEAAALIKSELEAAGFLPKLYTSGPQGQTNMIVRLPGRDRSKKPLLLLNHFDVVPVDAKAWGAIDPFGAAIKDGQIWGRGSLDMKGLAVEQMTALIELKRAGIVPPRGRDSQGDRDGKYR